MANDAETPVLPRVAFHHPWPPRDGHPIAGWLKTMLIFFDGAAVLVDPSEYDQLMKGQEETVYPLLDSNLLHLLNPDQVIDRAASEALVSYVLQLASSEEESALCRGQPIDPRRQFAGLGFYYTEPASFRSLSAEEQAASRRVWLELRRVGLASDYAADDMIFIEVDRWRRILAFLAQAIRPVGQSLGLDLHPATDDKEAIRNLISMSAEAQVTQGDIVAFDLEQVALDLTNVPIGDVLEFRERHGQLFRAYSRDIQRFAVEVSMCPPAERSGVFRSRRAELADEADELRRLARTWWRQPTASIGVGLVGAGVSAAGGQWPAALLSLLAGVIGANQRPEMSSAHAYLFKTQTWFGD
jgi:hypothetical protein